MLLTTVDTRTCHESSGKRGSSPHLCGQVPADAWVLDGSSSRPMARGTETIAARNGGEIAPNSTKGDGDEAAPLDRGRMVPVASAVEVTADSRHVHRDRRRRRAARSGCAGACGVGAGGSSTSGCGSVIRWPGGKCFGGLSPEARGHTVAAPATTHMRSRLWPCPRPAPTASVRQSPRGSQPEPFAARPCHRRGWTHHAMS
jgi:hypothetical protein